LEFPESFLDGVFLDFGVSDPCGANLERFLSDYFAIGVLVPGGANLDRFLSDYFYFGVLVPEGSLLNDFGEFIPGGANFESFLSDRLFDFGVLLLSDLFDGLAEFIYFRFKECLPDLGVWLPEFLETDSSCLSYCFFNSPQGSFGAFFSDFYLTKDNGKSIYYLTPL
jgi:hypothetical protein